MRKPSLDTIISERAKVKDTSQYVALGLSVKWATCNLGASMPWESGRYFASGDVKGQDWNGSRWSRRRFSHLPSYSLDANSNLNPEYDAAHANLDGTWRMPTKAEFQEFIDNSTSIWISNYNGTGIAGRIFTSKKAGYTDRSIFFPASGRGCDKGLDYSGSFGRYWSCTFRGGSNAWCLYFSLKDMNASHAYHYFGFSVRPVSE